VSDVTRNNATLAVTGSSGTTAPSAGTSETWAVAALPASFGAALGTGQTLRLVDSTAGASTGQQAEIVLLTASKGTRATSITVTRGVEGTTPVAHSTGATFAAVVTKAVFDAYETTAHASSAYPPAAVAAQSFADGVTDATDHIAARITAAKAFGAITGCPVTVQLGAGVHMVNFRNQPTDSSVKAAVQLPSGVSLRGHGAGATVIKLVNGATADGHMVQNTGLTGGDVNIGVYGLTIDGNGANQTGLPQGLSFLRARGIRIEDVRVINIRGTSGAPPGETFHFDIDQCVDVDFVACAAIGLAGTQGSGFGDNSSTNIRYVNCIADGMSGGMGYATWHSSNIAYANCSAQRCGANGFNAEFGADITYVGCHAGGNASDQAEGYTYANSAALGSSNGSGFCVNGCVQASLAGCHSRRNQGGLTVVSSGFTTSATVVGGYFCDNTALGIYFGDNACSKLSSVSSDTIVKDNAGGAQANWAVNDGVIGTFSGPTIINTPSVPASNTSLTNNYPFSVLVYFSSSSGLNYTSIDGVSVGVQGVVSVRPGGTIQNNYRTAPSWVWTRA